MDLELATSAFIKAAHAFSGIIGVYERDHPSMEPGIRRPRSGGIKQEEDQYCLATWYSDEEQRICDLEADMDER